MQTIILEQPGQFALTQTDAPTDFGADEVLGVHTDGGMRDVIRVPVAKLHRSETLSLEQLALVETLSIGAHAVQRAALEPGEFALVIGAGPIGLSVLQFAQAAGARVIAL